MSPVARSLGPGPALVFVHGLGCAAPFWEDVVAALASDHRCIVLDLDGFGEAPAPDEPLSVAGLARSLATDLAGLVTSPVVVIGHSLGGMVAQELALGSTGVVGALVLANTIPGCSEHVRAVNTALIGIVETEGPAGLARAMAAGLVGDPRLPHTDDARDRFVTQCSSTDARSLVGGLRAIIAFDATGRLGTLGVPALVVTGEYEGNMDDQERLALLVADGALTVLPGAGHLAPAEDPETFAGAVRAFLASLPAPLRAARGTRREPAGRPRRVLGAAGESPARVEPA